MSVIYCPAIPDHLPKEKKLNKTTYATCIISSSSGSNRNMNSPSIVVVSFTFPMFPEDLGSTELATALIPISRRTRVMMEDATLTQFPTCPTNDMRDPIADPEAGHMSHFC